MKDQFIGCVCAHGLHQRHKQTLSLRLLVMTSNGRTTKQNVDGATV